MKEIFDDYVKSAYRRKDMSQSKINEIELNYRQYFPYDKSCEVLDVGIGTGEMLWCMKEWGYQYCGIDISPATVQFCADAGLNAELVDDTPAWLTKKPDRYGLISLLDVLEHIPKNGCIGFLKALRASLTYDGTLLISVPNLQAPHASLHRYNDITHEVGYTEQSLYQVLYAAGFTDIKFLGLEGVPARRLHKIYKMVFRPLYWRLVRLSRAINENLNPVVLNPVLIAVVKKSH